MDNNIKDAKKNKLAADYLAVPLMLNFDFTPEKRNGLVSALVLVQGICTVQDKR
jgi:hypothetical protein